MPQTFHTSLVNFKEVGVTNLSTFWADISHFPALATALQLTTAGLVSGKKQVQLDTPAPSLPTHFCLLPFKLET